MSLLLDSLDFLATIGIPLYIDKFSQVVRSFFRNVTTNQEKKVKGVADLVFLIDVSGSMGPVIEDLVKNISVFVDSLTTKDANNGCPIKDWRGKVVGYRDIDSDGSDWFVDNPFVRDGGDLKVQLAKLQAAGGGDEPESLLDAIYRVATMPVTEKGTERPDSWRYRRDATRVVIVFTDASFKGSFAIPESSGTGALADLKNLITANRLVLAVFSPEMPCYDDFSDVDGSEFEMIPYDASDSQGAVKALRDYTANSENFKHVLKALAASISKSADTELI